MGDSDINNPIDSLLNEQQQQSSNKEQEIKQNEPINFKYDPI
jgi:hypothetical protein